MQTTFVAPTLKDSRVHIKHASYAYNVYKTTDLSIFKIMDDNRVVNELHVRRLVESFKDHYLISPITVNEKMEVIDGQHRLSACRLMGPGWPIYFLVIPGYGIKEVQVLNTNQKNWNKLDFLKMYVAQGKPVYVQFNKFLNDFPELDFIACERMARILQSKGKDFKSGGQRGQLKDFEEGKFVMPNIDKSYQMARKVMDFKPHYKGFHKGTFVSALMGLFPNKVYNHKEMIYKCSIAPLNLALQDTNTVENYRLQLEDIYNWKRNKENKVSFKYLN